MTADEAKLYHDIKKLKGKLSDSEIIQVFEDRVIYANNPYISFRFLYYYGDKTNVYQHVMTIAKSENPEVNYLSALAFPEWEMGVINAGNIEIPYNSLMLFKAAVLLSKDPEFNYKFARDVKSISIGRMKYRDSYMDYMSEISPYDIEMDPYTTVSSNTLLRTMVELVADPSNIDLYEDLHIVVFDEDNELHRKVVFESGNEEYIKKFIEDIDTKNNRKKSL